MPRRKRKSDDDLNQLEFEEQRLMLRAKEIAENRQRIAEERIERESTIPPLEEIREREARKKYEETVSRGEVANLVRTQNRSLLLLVLLVTAACTLVWWGLRVMQGV
ncbi:MAG: hypothetical protein H7A49_01045 [Akkermansiaceae bacterium]|nr:hypothetical protein [Akkermansiaceae bacterium]MCP5542470.1 hypothetical protein [Akkermansiaceae bacterium]MCP5545995.1 hypothetical protein [Akkermansiaceae bacterium]